MKHFHVKAIILGLLSMMLAWPATTSIERPDVADQWGINEQVLANVITDSVIKKQLPQTISIPGFQINDPLRVNYTIDKALESKAHSLLKKYNPDYGIFVAINPENGHILAMVDSTRDGINHGNLSLTNTFPAASVSKIITAVAAVNEKKANLNTVIPFNGKNDFVVQKKCVQAQEHQIHQALYAVRAFCQVRKFGVWPAWRNSPWWSDNA